jgi:transposase-like protein
MEHTENPYLQEVMELIIAGRTSDLTCPFCRDDKLEEEGSAWGKRYVCNKCDKFIEAPPEL